MFKPVGRDITEAGRVLPSAPSVGGPGVDLVACIRDAGVVGAGGAGFPAHVKAAARAEILIANGAECEPLLVTDQWIATRHAREIAEAMRAVAARVGARRLIFGVKAHYHPVIEAIRPFLNGDPQIELAGVDDFYPAGDEQVLVHEVTGRIVPEGGIPLDVGVVVQNVATMVNVRRAMDGVPVTRKDVTVAGLVANPGVFDVPVGISAAEVIAAAGGMTEADVAVIEGGPMMGLLRDDLSAPVTKTTGAYLVLPADNTVVTSRRSSHAAVFRRALAVCCQCRICTDQCSRALLGHRIAPHLAMRALLAGADISPMVRAMGYLCSQCGICEVWACPLGLSPRYVLGDFKAGMLAERLANPLRDRTEAVLEAQTWIRVPKPRLVERLGLKPYLLPHQGVPVVVPDPWEVRLNLKQHVGVPAVPIVLAGEHVVAGTCIAEIPDGALGARVHASMAGVVRSVDALSIRIERAH